MRPPAIHRLMAELAAIYRTEGRVAADLTTEAMVNGPIAGAFAPEPPCLHDAMIRDILACSDHPIAATILAAQHLIPWRENGIAKPLREDAAAMSSVAILMGNEGPVVAADLRMGLFFQAPDSYYALHNHDADETFVILCGEALWTAGDDIRTRRPGDMIHHPSLMPHAFRSGPEGLLALWRWSGDVNRHSYAFLEDPLADLA